MGAVDIPGDLGLPMPKKIWRAVIQADGQAWVDNCRSFRRLAKAEASCNDTSLFPIA